MDVAALLVFAVFFTALVVTTTSRYDVLRASIRRPRLFQLAAVGAVVALSGGNDTLSRGNGSGSAGVGSSAGGGGSAAGSALAVYSLLVCLISASSLFRRRARSAIGPQEG